MSQPYKTVRSEAEVVVGGVSPGERPSVTITYDTVGRGNVARLFVRRLAVPNASLFQRLEADVVKGDKIEVIVTTDWYDTGSVTILENFTKVAPPERQTETVQIVINGNSNVVQSDITQIDVPTVQTSREKARK